MTVIVDIAGQNWQAVEAELLANGKIEVRCGLIGMNKQICEY